MHKVSMISTLSVAAMLATSAAPALANEAGDMFVRVSAARTKLVDKGEVYIDRTLDPAAAYSTRDTYNNALTLGYFVHDMVAVEGSISTPATTNNMPAGSLAGQPNLGDDEFFIATLGASLHPVKGPISPYVGGGLQMQFTSQQRDGLAVGLNIPNSHGPYVQAGVDFALSERFGLFAEARKAWYHANATGLMPLDATYTQFAAVDAKAQLDPITFQLGLVAKFGPSSRKSAAGTSSPAIETDTSRWTVRLGFSNLSLADKVDLNVGGTPLPGAGLSTFEHHSFTAQVGYYVTDNIAINATVGVPPSIDIYGAGAIGALPKLGKITYGPTALTLQYHPTRSGRIRPYVGAGISYMIVFDTKDGAFEDLKVDNDLGAAFEAGTDFMLTNKMGLFVDVKKALLRSMAYGKFSGADVRGKTRLDPWVFTGGLSFHF